MYATCSTRLNLCQFRQASFLKWNIVSVSCMNCQTTSEQPFKELFIQINQHVKFIDRGFQDWQGPEMINDYECRG